MDYEKAYKESFEAAKGLHEAGNALTKKQMEIVFPQLAESEDERIRKWIANYIHRGVFDEEEHPKALKAVEWLEKQKEQHLELKAGKWYICHRAFCARADHLTVKEGERFQCEKDGIVKGFVIKEPEKYFKECSAPAPMEDEQKEQKPAEWSEEDEDMLNSCISSIEEAKENRYAYKETDGDTSYDHEIAWLKSLRNRVGKEFLQPHWKPTEEQMKALLKAVDKARELHYSSNSGYDEYDVLRLLYKQLKELNDDNDR